MIKEFKNLESIIGYFLLLTSLILFMLYITNSRQSDNSVEQSIFAVLSILSILIGGWQLETNRTFDTQIIDYQKGDMIYLGSDGFQDQIGGGNNKKYKSAHLHSFIQSISSFPMEEQEKHLKTEFLNWKKMNSQTDDVCLVGLKL